MALFGKKQKTEATQPAVQAEPQVRAARDISSVLIKPRITEKAVGMSERNVYAFVVHSDATKRDIKEAIEVAFNVTPVRVSIVKQTPRSYVSRRIGRTVSTKGIKKAYVYLKKGETINLM